MDVESAYNQWAEVYDSNENPTRDLEGKALREMLSPIVSSISYVLEVGCGTGKNTEYFLLNHESIQKVVSVDLSEGMLQRAKERFVDNERVSFVKADVTESDWKAFLPATISKYDLVSFSLILEHIEDLPAIFAKVAAHTSSGSYLYVGELHPYKQYQGSKARFGTEDNTVIVKCHQHHISDFTRAADRAGFQLLQLDEHFDSTGAFPRILALLFRKR